MILSQSPVLDPGTLLTVRFPYHTRWRSGIDGLMSIFTGQVDWTDPRQESDLLPVEVLLVINKIGNVYYVIAGDRVCTLFAWDLPFFAK